MDEKKPLEAFGDAMGIYEKWLGTVKDAIDHMEEGKRGEFIAHFGPNGTGQGANAAAFMQFLRGTARSTLERVSFSLGIFPIQFMAFKEGEPTDTVLGYWQTRMRDAGAFIAAAVGSADAPELDARTYLKLAALTELEGYIDSLHNTDDARRNGPR